MPFIDLAIGRIEYTFISAFEPAAGGPASSGMLARDPAAPTIVMLHEGLGSLSMWKDFPTKLAQRCRCDVMVYSRHGYGQSEALRHSRTVTYMHYEALTVLPELLDRLEIEKPILFGHSDGGSIALIHAGGSRRPVRGMIALAPHVFVEDLSVTNIAVAKQAYETTDMRARLARYHADVDGAFWGWNNIWLNPDFRAWNIEDYLPGIECPVLVIQGKEDQYGTVEQLRRIARHSSAVELEYLADCAHSPHRDQPEAVLTRVARWLDSRKLAARHASPARVSQPPCSR